MKKTFKKEQLDKVKIFAENFFWNADELQTERDTGFLGTTSLMLKDLSEEKINNILED